MKKYTHIVWDFNGTILDDVGICIKCVNTLLERRSMPTVDSIERYHSVFGFPITEYYKKLGFDFEKEPFGEIAIEWVNEYNARRRTASTCKNVISVLEYFRKCGIPQLIISATEVNMLREQIDELKVREYFDELIGLDNIHAGSKKHLAEQWREAHPNAKVLFIGDTDHDYEVADAMGADCILVAQGHQSLEYLSSICPHTVRDVSDIISVIKANSQN
ncbi:MAG: HAD family hydrolase [Clostridia bacterium]|nr:HAD family hydrolase [Clostridia bacterium]